AHPLRSAFFPTRRSSDLFVREGGWARREPAPSLGWDLAGKTLGLIGFGRIGRAVAERARAFGMRVIYHDTFTDPGAGWDDCQYRDRKSTRLNSSHVKTSY